LFAKIGMLTVGALVASFLYECHKEITGRTESLNAIGRQLDNLQATR
jgi:hypothetical protein